MVMFHYLFVTYYVKNNKSRVGKSHLSLLCMLMVNVNGGDICIGAITGSNDTIVYKSSSPTRYRRASFVCSLGKAHDGHQGTLKYLAKPLLGVHKSDYATRMAVIRALHCMYVLHINNKG